jgi:hypothetical protein
MKVDGCFQRKNYLQKERLMQITDKVARRAQLFQSQLGECQGDLENKG